MASKLIRAVFGILHWGMKRTFNTADEVSFELKHSFLNHKRISYHTKDISSRQRGVVRSWSTLIGKEATCVALARDTSRSDLAIDCGHVRGPSASESTTSCC